MRKTALFFLLTGILMLMLAFPASAAIELTPSDRSDAAEISIEAEDVPLSELPESVEIEDEETPLAAAPETGASPMAKVMTGAGVCMILVAGAILVFGTRHHRAYDRQRR